MAFQRAPAAPAALRRPRHRSLGGGGAHDGPPCTRPRVYRARPACGGPSPTTALGAIGAVGFSAMGLSVFAVPFLIPIRCLLGVEVQLCAVQHLGIGGSVAGAPQPPLGHIPTGVLGDSPVPANVSPHAVTKTAVRAAVPGVMMRGQPPQLPPFYCLPSPMPRERETSSLPNGRCVLVPPTRGGPGPRCHPWCHLPSLRRPGWSVCPSP